MKESVIIVDKKDRSFGTMDKMAAHHAGQLHRAFSIFIFNSKGELLLQQRALNKYHSGGKWTNTCCSHPKPGEQTEAAAHRRLQEEMGFDCDLHYLFNFTYRAELDGGIIEHELDHVFYGISDTAPKPAIEEVANSRYISMADLDIALKTNPDEYTEWLKICFEQVKGAYQNTLFK